VRVLVAYPLPETIPDLCPGCGWQLMKGVLVITTMIDTRHLGCASPAMVREAACCPHCMERHPQPYDGMCLL